MKATTPQLLEHFQGEEQTVSTCWKLTRKDGQLFAFTDSDVDLPYGGLTYLAATGFTPSSVETTGELNVDNLEVQGVLSSDTITDADLHAGLWDYAEVEVFLVNRENLAMGAMKLRRGRLGEVSTGRMAFSAELRGLTQNLQQIVGRLFTAVCQADFGDAKCGKNLSALKVTGSVTANSDNLTVFGDSSRTETVSYFRGGKVRFLTGLNSGSEMEVKAFNGSGGFTLHQPFPFSISIGDTYEAWPGCDKTLGTCKERWSNVVNFRGFPHVPGNDRLATGK